MTDRPEDVMRLAAETCAEHEYSAKNADATWSSVCLAIAEGIMADRASRSDMTDRPAIKPLEWSEQIGISYAKTPFGVYKVADHGAWWFDDGPIKGNLGRQQAQSDFEARIRSCLLDKPGAVETVGEAGEMPGSNGGFTMAVFKASDVPLGTKLYTRPADTDAAQCARRKAFEEAAELIEANIVKDSSAGKFLAPRQEGNRDGLHYAAAIRQLAEEEAR